MLPSWLTLRIYDWTGRLAIKAGAKLPIRRVGDSTVSQADPHGVAMRSRRGTCHCPLLWFLLAALTLTGCKPATPGSLPASFDPPGIDGLAGIDLAGTSYDDRCAVIEGVVAPAGQGSWPGRTNDHEVHCFTLSAWRHVGRPVVEKELTILRPVPRGADYSSDFPKGSVHRMSVLLSTDQTRAIFEKALPLDSPSQELLAFARKSQEPVVVATRRFGELVLDRNTGTFQGEAEWGSATVSISLPDTKEEPIEESLKTVESLFSQQADWKERIEGHAVKTLLVLKNESWLDEGEKPVTAERFRARMTLEAIHILPDGDFEFWYDDGNLFRGHAIMVSGNVSGELSDAGIHG